MRHNPELIVGLDVPTVREAEMIVDQLGDFVSFYKIGYQLVFNGGLSLARTLVQAGKKVFLDLKLLDIDNTVARCVENIAKMQISMLTVHAYPKVMRAASKAANGSGLCVLGVTVLTSMDAEDLKEAGYALTPQDLVIKRANQAQEIGLGGIVASAQEAPLLRSVIGKDMALVTPGIRMPSDECADQKRITTPKQAIEGGATHLVVARPIIQAEDRRAAAQVFLEAMK